MPGDEIVLDFASDPARLSLSIGRLKIQRENQPDLTVPLRDTAIVIIANERLSCTGAALAAIMQHGGAMVICDSTQTPVGTMLPLQANTLQTQRMIAQASSSTPLRKRLWQSVVRAKILAQAHTLQLATDDDAGLTVLANTVKSGDPTNIESTAAQRYWPRIFGDPMFRRRRDAPDQNRLLNYGYAIVRAGMGRAIVAAGLHPSLGIHHRSRSNPWVLADDLMEPYRSLVDDETAEIVRSFGSDVAIDGPIKSRLIGVLHARIGHTKSSRTENRTTLDWMARTAASVAQVFTKHPDKTSQRTVFYPDGLWCEVTRR